MKISASSLALGLVFVSAQAFGDPIKRIASPTLSPDGSTIAFSWQGDIWTVPVGGGRGERLTVHPASDSAPVWTPDGKSIIFSSARYGGNNLYKMSKAGSGIKRLTFESGNLVATSVSPDGKYVYGQCSSFGARTNLFRVPTTGGSIARLTMDTLEGSVYAKVSPDGSKLYYTRGSYGANGWQKPGVRASGMPAIWTADITVPLSNQKALQRKEEGTYFHNLTTDGHLYFVSNRNGWPNVFVAKADGSEARQLTSHQNGTFSALSVSADGKRAIYVFESELYSLDLKTGLSSKVEVEVPDDMRATPTQDITITDLQSYDVSPDGKRIIIQSRGDLFVLPEKGGTTKRLTTNPRLDSEPAWLDAKTVLYVAAGEKAKRELRTVSMDGTSKVWASADTDLTAPSVSPDGKSVAYIKGREEIVVRGTAADSKEVSVIKGNFYDGGNYSWSPDSKYLVIAKPTARASTEIIVAEVAGTKRYTVGRAARRDVSTPRFLNNGKGVFFTSNEYPDANDLFVIDFAPAEPTFTEDDLDKVDDAPRRRARTEGAPAAEKPEIKIDIVMEGIENRMRRLTNGNAGEAVNSADGKTLYFSNDGQLSSVAVAGGPIVPLAGLTNGAGLLFANGKLYFIGAGGKLASWAPGSPAASPISYSSTFTVNLREEEKALFEEIGWQIDRNYYDPQHHGKDWNAILDKFSKIVPYVQDRQDFYALMGEMMEELDSSHLGSTPPPAESFGTDSGASLGVDFDPKGIDARNSFVVTRVLTGSCGANPASRLNIGDRILSVDGVSIDAEHPLGMLLNKKAGKKVQLKIDRDGKTVDVTIKPDSAAARREQEYQNWVSWQRQQTDRLSGGKLAYLHVRAMDDPSFQLFLRQIRTLTVGKQGVLVDVRYNGGGSTSHKLLGVLIKQPWLIRTTRGLDGLKLSENIYRGDSLELPTALLFNSYSFSNAEIMGEGFRRLNRGYSIGERTPGYVIGTGGQTLWDGGFIRMPSIGAYAVNGENLENNGRKPDFNVPYNPDLWASGRDVQLEKAVEVLLKQLGG